MPRYHFNLRADGTIYRDLDGAELRDVQAARAHAAIVAQELMWHSSDSTRLWSIFVEDEWGQGKFEMSFTNVIASSLDPYSPVQRKLAFEVCWLLVRARRKPLLVCGA